MTARFLPQALAEMKAEARWYNRRQAGLGREFILAVRATLRVVESDPVRFARTNPRARKRAFRRARVARFPYDVVFEIEEAGIVIVAIAHHARRPGYYRQREG